MTVTNLTRNDLNDSRPTSALPSLKNMSKHSETMLLVDGDQAALELKERVHRRGEDNAPQAESALEASQRGASALFTRETPLCWE